MSLLSELQNSIKKFDLQNVNKILDLSKTRTNVTFWGTRVISIDGYGEESIAINQIASLMINCNGLRTQDARGEYLIRKETKEAAYFITKKLIDFYNNSDQQIVEAKWITQIFVAIFEWWPIRFLVEWHWPSIRGQTQLHLDYRAHWDPNYFNILPPNCADS